MAETIEHQEQPVPRETLSPGQNLLAQPPFNTVLESEATQAKIAGYVQENPKLTFDQPLLRSVVSLCAVDLETELSREESDEQRERNYDAVITRGNVATMLRKLRKKVEYAVPVYRVAQALLAQLKLHTEWYLYLSEYVGGSKRKGEYKHDGSLLPTSVFLPEVPTYKTWIRTNKRVRRSDADIATKDTRQSAYGFEETLPTGYPTRPSSPHALIGKSSAAQELQQRKNAKN